MVFFSLIASESQLKVLLIARYRIGGKYELDVKDVQIYDPTSLFMRAKK